MASLTFTQPTGSASSPVACAGTYTTDGGGPNDPPIGEDPITYEVRCAAKPSGGSYGADTTAAMNAGNWTCSLTVTPAGTYDLRARLFSVQSGAATLLATATDAGVAIS